MADFNIGRDLETVEPTIEVTVNEEKPLSVGRHQFRLVVVDDAGNESLPDVVEVVVQDTQNPTAILKTASQVEFGKSFILDGRSSSDIPPGRIVKYIWTMLE